MLHTLVSNIQLYFDTLLISWMQNQGQQAGGYHPAAIARDIGAIHIKANKSHTGQQDGKDNARLI